MINLALVLISIGSTLIIAFALIYIIKRLYEEWKVGFKEDVLFVLTFLIPLIFIAIGLVIYAIYK
ncbi:hypothetical protein RM652_02690 [Mammaliicoccus sciuri]|uniref:hypothetical protein n=1 Tax=Mammaliicoccus sciuri TaxID=1296 RepID=UPI002888420D|nr:hypothetical protein [Mammaliicoccus sciuri]MDT0702010.1 hypothetical protein [Mammaliicoccus sciuri]